VLIFRRTIVLVQHLVSSLSLGDCSVHRLGDDLLKMGTIVLETCNKCIKIKDLCIKLLKKTTIIVVGCTVHKTYKNARNKFVHFVDLVS